MSHFKPLIARGDKLLVCQRSPHKCHGGLSEFPGGKLEPGEDDEMAEAPVFSRKRLCTVKGNMTRVKCVMAGAILGGSVGSVVLNVITLQALALKPRGGIGETRMWFDIVATIWAMPLSFLGEVLIPQAPRWVIGLTVVLNGALWGAIVGLITQMISVRHASQARVTE